MFDIWYTAIKLMLKTKQNFLLKQLKVFSQANVVHKNMNVHIRKLIHKPMCTHAH